MACGASGKERAPAPASCPRADLRDPWPDGPRSRIDAVFQDACLDTGAFSALAGVRPDATLEVLLAVCIEKPVHETYSRPSMPETGLDHWNHAEPPLYCRGPFLLFCGKRPSKGCPLCSGWSTRNAPVRRRAEPWLDPHHRQRGPHVARQFECFPLAL